MTVATGPYPQRLPAGGPVHNEPAGGPSIRYYRIGGATADVVPEFGLKPDSGLSITAVDVLLEKIASTVRFSDEYAEDAPFLLNLPAGRAGRGRRHQGERRDRATTT